MTATDHVADLRSRLVDELAEWEPFRVGSVEQAMRTVPRHAFLPDLPVDEAYQNMSVVTHRDSAGVATSSASAPMTVAAMLQQLEVLPGHRVLEVGAGTGYNAALVANLVGPSGHVTTVDIDPELTAAAQRNLVSAGYENVRVVCGDGADGDAENAPFDRVVVTAGAWDIPPSLLDQLAEGGRLVLPLRMRGLTRVVALERLDGVWRSVSAENDGFIPLRGVGHQPERNVPLHDAGSVILRIDDGQPVDPDGLRRAVGGAPVRVWTGVMATEGEVAIGFAELDYWLAASSCLSRLLIRSAEHNLVKPALAYGSMALLDHDSLAYLAKRPDGEASEYEIGVCAYGPSARRLATVAVEAIRAWDAGRNQATWIEVYPIDELVPDLDETVLLMTEKRHVQIVVRGQAADTSS